MGIEKALTQAKQFRNFFKVFEDAEEWMRETVALQNVVKEFEDRKAALVADINTLGLDKVKLLKTMAELKEKKQAELDAIMADTSEKLLVRNAEVTAEIKSLGSERDAVDACLKEATKLHDQEMERMRIETEQAEVTLKTVQGKIQAIKVKLE